VNSFASKELKSRLLRALVDEVWDGIAPMPLSDSFALRELTRPRRLRCARLRVLAEIQQDRGEV
jgi:hypothetical protein